MAAETLKNETIIESKTGPVSPGFVRADNAKSSDLRGCADRRVANMSMGDGEPIG